MRPTALPPRRASPSIQDIVADDVPVLPLWQGKQYVAARDDITGVEWALNSSLDPSAVGARPRRERLTRRDPASPRVPTAATAAPD